MENNLNMRSNAMVKRQNRIRESLLRVALGLSMFCSYSVSAEPNAEPDALASNKKWYQIEIILFAQITPLASDEIQSSEPSYPDQVIGLSPASEETEKSLLLSDMVEILEFNKPATLDVALELSLSESEIEDEIEVEAALLVAEEKIAQLISEGEPRLGEPTALELETIAAVVPAESYPGFIDEVAVQSMVSMETPWPFRNLEKDQRQLNKIAGSIRRSKGYRFISHDAWYQPVDSADKAIPVYLARGKDINSQPEIEGFVEVSVSRYLHFSSNLWFRELAQPGLLDASNTFATESNLSEMNVLTHKITESRRMRSKTIHYIDHPYFGALIKIVAVEEPIEKPTEISEAAS